MTANCTMQYKDRSVTLDRLELLWNGREYPDKYKVSLKSQLYPVSMAPGTLQVLKDTGVISFAEAKSRIDDFVDCKVGDEFGTSWHTHWFYVEFQADPEWIKNGSEIHLVWDSSSEAMIYDGNGKPLQGLTGGNRTDFVVSRKGYRDIDASGKVSYFLEMVCGTLGGNSADGNFLHGVDMNKMFRLNECKLSVFDREVWDLMMDFKVLKDCAKNLDTKQGNRADEALFVANEIVNVCRPGDRATYAPCRALAKKFLQVGNHETQHTLYAVGHCHIDMAWLWPFFETRRKGGRSWSTQTELFKQYSPFSFCASSAALYEWVMQDYPLLFEEIKKYVAEGRFCPVGGSWLEFDGNLPSGESMARQMLYGQRFFKKHFGLHCDTFFLPDTFGYSAQLPQIVRLGGMKYFVTQKLCWSRYNHFPHNSFHWKGIDGTQVLTHFPPANTYNGNGEVQQTLFSFTNFQDKGRSSESLYLFGQGDGGGGPLPQMVDKLLRMQDVAGLPKVKMGGSVSTFFAALEKNEKSLMTWDGELYLETHNGTYTTMAKNKRYNRVCEFLMRDAELFATLRYVILDKGKGEYDKDMYDEVWKNMMLFQFHDVLPGSSIRLVYDVTDKEYPVMIEKLKANITKSLAALAEGLLKSDSPARADSDTANTVVLFNSLTCDREQVLEWSRNGTTFYSPVTVKGVGCAAYPTELLEKISIKTRQCKVTVFDAITVSNEFIEARLSFDGKLLSLKDKTTAEYADPGTAKEVIQRGDQYSAGNMLLIHKDIPLQFDAWDLWVYYMETRREIKANYYRVTEKPHQVEIEFRYKISDKSSMTQIVVVHGKSKRIDFVTTADWHEEHKVLRTYFPLAIRTDQVTCDIQNGTLRRPTTANTRWEMAKYEVCAHKFVDMSDAHYGVTLMNDCKYGYSARGNVLSLSLLKSSKGPNEVADMGAHVFTYSLYPHTGNLEASDAPQESMRLNNELYQVWCNSAIKEMRQTQYVTLDKPDVWLDALKLAEDDKKTVIMRVHEGTGTACCNRIGLGFEVRNPEVVNLLEEKMEDSEAIIKSDGKQLFHRVKPFQIQTFKFSPTY